MSPLLNILAAVLVLAALAGADDRSHPDACRFDCGEPR